MTTTLDAALGGLQRTPARRTKVGLVSGGLGAYWPQFPELLPQLQRSSARVAERMRALDCEVVDVGFISDAQDGARAGRVSPEDARPPTKAVARIAKLAGLGEGKLCARRGRPRNVTVRVKVSR